MNKIIFNKVVKKILVIKPSSLGDVIHSLPFLSALRDAFPAAEIHWIIAKGLEGLFEDHPMVNKLWIINKDRWKKLKDIKDTSSEIKELARGLRRESYDMVVDLQGLLRSGLLAYATHAPVRIGFQEAREGSALFYTHKIRGGREIHAVDRCLKIASAIGCDVKEVNFPMPLFKESDKIKKLMEEIGNYAVIVPGARWLTKRWHPERFGELASMLNMKTVIVGSAADREISKVIENMSEGNAISMAGKTDIRELISIIRNARYVISNDSGPMHIAAAVGVRVIALFGPTNPVRTGPYGDKNIIVNAGVKCSPCYKKRCSDKRCMDNITVDMVYNTINHSKNLKDPVLG
ncbi:MAG: lipopolysaccharide heptosyltransferase I [Thermodesulfovibrionales bacterium]|nr:lipopolysaccharide heptosyltransferase I [Thermodesulfovibrionales bacterium]